MANRKPKRRFVDLQVDEVSLVDTPANEIPFLVTKNKVEESMDQENASETTKATAVPVTQTEGRNPEAVQKALEEVNKIVGSVVSVLKANKEAAAGEPEKTTKAAEAKTEETKTEKAEEPAKKTETETKSVVKSAEESMLELSETIAKAARLTPARVESIKEAIEALKLVIEGVAPGTAPSTKTPDGSFGGSMVKPMGTDGTPVVKAEDEALTKLVSSIKELTETVSKSMTDLTGRVESIEKAKPAPSGEGESGTQTNVDTQKSIWGGII